MGEIIPNKTECNILEETVIQSRIWKLNDRKYLNDERKMKNNCLLR